MILGIGIDLIEVERIKKAMDNPRFLKRILTEREMLPNMTPEHIAGRWASKEAISKATIFTLKWHNVQILNNEIGVPKVEIIGVQDFYGKIMLSISHSKNNAVAVAVWMSK